LIASKKDLTGQVRPSFLEESFHIPSTFTHWRIIFIKDLAVLKDQIDVILKLISAFVYPIVEFLPDGRDVHGDADDFLVSRELLGVDRG